MSGTASSFTACTFENNEAVRLCLTNRRLLKRTHTSMLFLSLSLRLLLLVLLLTYSVVMAVLAGLTSRTVATAAVSASGDRRNHHHSYGKRTNLRLTMMMIGSLGLRCCGCCCYGHSQVHDIVVSDTRHE